MPIYQNVKDEQTERLFPYRYYARVLTRETPLRHGGKVLPGVCLSSCLLAG